MEIKVDGPVLNPLLMMEEIRAYQLSEKKNVDRIKSF